MMFRSLASRRRLPRPVQVEQAITFHVLIDDSDRENLKCGPKVSIGCGYTIRYLAHTKPKLVGNRL